jgi:hypothetical protein
MRMPSTFRESHVRRAVRALEAEGKQVVAIEIEGGCIRIKLKNGNVADDTIETADELRKLI